MMQDASDPELKIQLIEEKSPEKSIKSKAVCDEGNWIGGNSKTTIQQPNLHTQTNGYKFIIKSSSQPHNSEEHLAFINSETINLNG